MKLKIKLFVMALGCITIFLALLMPHIFVGLRSWSLEYAVERGDTHTTALLLNSGANPNMPDDGYPPLMQALQRRHDDVAYLLIDKGANVNAVGPFGTTPLLCVDLNDTRLISCLIQHGADVNTQDNTGTTALMIASADLHSDAVSMLLARGANPNAQDKDGQTPLMQAITSDYSHDKPVQQLEIVEKLLKGGANTTITDVKKQDAVALARETKNNPVLDILTERRHKNN